MKKFFSTWKKEKIIALSIILTALILRTARVYFYEQPVFADEAIYVRWSQVMRAENTLRFLPLSDGKQPLFMWVTIPFLKVFTDPVVAGRMVSVMTGMGTLIGVMIFTFLLFAKREIVKTLFSGKDFYKNLLQLKKADIGETVNLALIAGLLYAMSPFAVFFDSMALVDSMLSMFGIWTLVFVFLTIITLRLDFAILAGFALGGAFLTKSPALYFALLVPGMFLFMKWSGNVKSNIQRLLKAGYLFSATYIIALGLFNILRLGPNFQMLAIRNRDYVNPVSHIFESPLDPLIPFLTRSVEWFWILGPAALVLMLIAGVWIGLLKFRVQTLFLLAWTFIPLVASAEFSKTFTARYVLFSLPTFIILASVFAANVKWNKLFRVLLLAFLLHSIFINFRLITNIRNAPLPAGERSGYLEEWTSGYGIKESSEYLIDLHQNRPEEKIIVGTEGYFGTLPDGLQAYLNNYPEITVIGVGLDLGEIPNSLKESKDAGNRTFLLINDTRLKAKPDEIGLSAVADYPKAERKKGTYSFEKFGTNETLHLFEVH